MPLTFKASLKGRVKGTTTRKRSKGPRTGGRLIKKSVVSICKKTLERQAEKKQANFSAAFLFGSSNNSSFLTQQVVPVSPYTGFISILQGTSQGSRIGNKLRIVKCTMTGVLTPTAYNVTSNPNPQPQEVRLWFFSQKNENSPPSSFSTFFQNGGASTNFVGSLTDLNKKVNNDNYTYLMHRTYKLGYSAFVGTPGGVVGSGYFSNNDFALNRRFTIDLTKIMPKVITYNDNTDLPSSKAIWFVIECVNSDGTTMGTAVSPCALYYSLQTIYTDI